MEVSDLIVYIKNTWSWTTAKDKTESNKRLQHLDKAWNYFFMYKNVYKWPMKIVTWNIMYNVGYNPCTKSFRTWSLYIEPVVFQFPFGTLRSVPQISGVLPPGTQFDGQSNKPIQDGGEAKAPLWLNRLSGTYWLTNRGEPQRGFRL